MCNMLRRMPPEIRRAFCARILVLLVGFLTTLSAAFAQLSTATLNGVVRDSSGAVVAKADVVLRNTETTVERSTLSNDTGEYVFVNMAPGRYTLAVSVAGFASKRVAEFVLGVNQTATIDVSLAPGGQTEVVTVEASAEQMQVSTADLGTVIATKQVNDLPLNGRNFTQLLQLTPGVAPVNVAQSGGSGGSGGFGAAIALGSSFQFPAINGMTNRSNFFLTDGFNNYGSIESTYAVPPIIDAIQEFKVVSHTDSAEFGSVLGGVINVVTKSGTNEYHGSAWEYVRNNVFDSRPAFLKPTDKAPAFRQNQFGASFGGPVWIPKVYQGKNKTFFFVAYQGFRYTRDNASRLLVPTDAQLNGDLSDFPSQIYNPFTTRPDPNNPGQYIRDPFPGNRIPANLIDPGMVAWAKAIFPTAGPYDKPTNSNAIDTTPTHQFQNEYTIRVDQNFSQKDSLVFRYSAINSTLTRGGGIPNLLSRGEIPGRNWGGSYLHVFSPSLMLQAHYARTATQDNAATRFTNLAANLLSTIGFSSSFVGGFVAANGSMVPSPGISGFANGGEFIRNDPKATDSHQISATLTKTKSAHTLSFGGGFTTNRFASPLAGASLGFAGGQTGNPANVNGTEPGSPLASFLLGVPDNANRRNVNEQTRLGGVMSWFFQDSWKATSRLTINTGLRYDVTYIPPYGTNATIAQQGGIETGDINFRTGEYVLQLVPPPCSVRGNAPCIPDISGQPAGTLPAHVIVDPRGKIAHNTYTNFGPRLGFAYRVTNDTAIRAAAGVVYDNWAAVSQMAQNIEGAWPDIGQLIAQNLNPPTGPPTTRAQNPFGTTSGLFPAPTPFDQVQWFYDPYIKNPYSMQWNFGVQHQLNSSTMIEADYVGSRSRRLNVGGFYNTALTPGPGDPRSRALFPYIAPTFYDRSIGHGTYDAMQLEVKKRYTGGLSYQVAYTYSKSLDEGSSGWFGVEGNSLTDPYNITGSRGPSGFDLTHTLAVNTIYDLPLGKGRRFLIHNSALNYALGNWQVNGIFSARSGLPFNVYYGASDWANTGNVSWNQYERANLVGDPHSGTCPNGSPVGSQSCFFNTSAFVAPPRYTFGNSGRDSMRSARYWNLDASVFKQFPFGETRRFEFRAEAFNLFNTVIFGRPGNDITNLSNFGKVNGAANSARQLQFGAKLLF
jgi:carboxypeptidase family protein